METMETILSRRSIRKYNGKKIAQEELDSILKAGMASPVGKAKYKNIHITVIENEKLLHEFDRAIAAYFKKPDLVPLYDAPTLIIVSVMPYTEKIKNIQYSDGATIIENMALTAVSLGIGSCHIWSAVRMMEENTKMISLLDIPEGFTPTSGIVLGRFDGDYKERNIPSDRINVNYIR